MKGVRFGKFEIIEQKSEIIYGVIKFGKKMIRYMVCNDDNMVVYRKIIEGQKGNVKEMEMEQFKILVNNLKELGLKSEWNEIDKIIKKL